MSWQFFPRVLEKFNLAVFHGSETQTKRKERGIVVASPLRSIINNQNEAMREKLGFQPLPYLAGEP